MESLESTRKVRAYTSVMSLLNLMCEKRLVKRRPAGRAFTYEAKVPRSKTLGRLISDLCRRAFSDSASSLVAHMLDQTEPSPEELQAIRQAIDAYQEEHP
jgi:predicted transcriptional regulator